MTKYLAAIALLLAVMATAARPAAAQANGAIGPDPAFQQQATPATTPATAAAATPAPAGNEATSAVARFGPTIDGAKLLAPTRSQQARKLAHEPAYRHSEPGVALMIVGGAVFLAGAIIEGRGGDLLMVGGVVVAAIGLYQYLQ